MADNVLEFYWNDDPVQTFLLKLADEATALTAFDVALYAKIDPPYWLGNYQRSIRVIEPGYDADDFSDAQQGDLLSHNIEQLVEEVVDHEVWVGSFLPYSARIQSGASNPSQRFNLAVAAQERGTQENFDYNLHLVKSKYNVR